MFLGFLFGYPLVFEPSQPLRPGIGFGTLVSVIYRDITKLLMSHDIADATCGGGPSGVGEGFGGLGKGKVVGGGG